MAMVRDTFLTTHLNCLCDIFYGLSTNLIKYYQS